MSCSSRERDVFRIPGDRHWAHMAKSPGGRLFFQPFEAYFVENLTVPARGRKTGPAGQTQSKSNRKNRRRLKYSPPGPMQTMLTSNEKAGGHRPPGTEHVQDETVHILYSGKGFYSALLACTPAAAASSVWAIRTVVGRLNGTAESQSSSEEEFVWDAPEIRRWSAAPRMCPSSRTNCAGPPFLPCRRLPLPSGGQEDPWAAGRLAGSLLLPGRCLADARTLQRG